MAPGSPPRRAVHARRYGREAPVRKISWKALPSWSLPVMDMGHASAAARGSGLSAAVEEV